MSNNLPDGVNENTPNSPWNEELKTVLITAIVVMDTNIPINSGPKELAELRSEALDELRRSLIHTDFDIEEIIVEEM